MEAAAATAFAGRIAPKLLEFLAANHKLRRNLEHDITYIQREFALISAAVQQDDECRWRTGAVGDHVQRAWIQIIRGLAHAIEDCIDRFMHQVTISGTSTWIRQAVHRVQTATVRKEFAKAIHELKKISQESSKLRETYYNASIGTGTSSSSTAAASVACETMTEMVIDNSLSAGRPVGMDAPRDELLEMIQQQQQQLKVISIVGFDGIGKTLLARHVYDTIENQYEARAWVSAAEQGVPTDVIKEILQQLGIPANGGGNLSKLCSILRWYLGSRRFFIVIDDMRTEFWHDIKDAFVGLSGRVLVTTAIHSVANTCSSSAAHDHVYAMKTLADEHSRLLFFKEAFQDDNPPVDKEDQLGSEALKKCDGLPLALVTTARYLQSTGNPTHGNWATLCHNLGAHLETKEMLARMKRVLVHSYTSLVKHDVKTCLLYFGIYPSGRTVRRGSLIRKWCAEGFIQGDYMCNALDAATGNFKELVNRSIIQRTDAISKNSEDEVKTYHTHGMMLEFILHMAKCDNFITLLYDQMAPPPPPSRIRWLSLHDASAKVANDLSLVRSLTIFGKAHESVLDFCKYELLRVLDLEECANHLEDKHLKEICSNLLLLRYLSLGAAVKVTTLPKESKKLQLLETLDVRRTKIEILPTQVMELPCLIHLFGKFKLQEGVGSRKMHKLQTWFSENSKLETVAGFVVDNKSQGFAQLMEHMKHLTKVKIWCEQSINNSTGPTASDSNSSTNNYTHVSNAIKGFIKRSTDVKKAHSLSIHFNDKWFQDLLVNLSLEKEEASSCYLSSLKLQGGNICSLPPFVTMLGSLTKLCLSSPHHKLSGDILAALSRVRCLAYLKLIASQLDKLVIIKGALGSLRRLCIVVEVMTELEVQEGALPFLESLQLLCKDLNGFCCTTIQSLRRIKEVTLRDGVSDETKHEWKEAAKKHPRRPKLLFVKTAEDVDMGSEPTYNSEITTPHNAIFTGEPAQVDCDDLQQDDDEKDCTDKIDILEDFASKTCLDPPVDKESFEQGMEGMVGLEDQQMEDVTRSTDQADQNVVLLVVDENRRKRARFNIGEDNSMDKMVDRVKRKNPEDVQVGF
ncbi:disease resistance protein RGA4-like isoform X2 [Triticum urartu]|uniref:disease resistance protein RGA4-like isoform X2 n=1 Tax=Triticum urartu TaxID=4572 RepID=UPI0020438FA4|nr:disease resistance protein RGA4-like isoform X2 [Triticum urartu]